MKKDTGSRKSQSKLLDTIAFPEDLYPILERAMVIFKEQEGSCDSVLHGYCLKSPKPDLFPREEMSTSKHGRCLSFHYFRKPSSVGECKGVIEDFESLEKGTKDFVEAHQSIEAEVEEESTYDDYILLSVVIKFL